MAFKPLRYRQDLMDTVKQTAAANTVAKGDALEFESGYANRADSSDAEIHAVAMQDQTTAGSALDLQIMWTQDNPEFEGDTNSTTSQALVGTYIDLTDHATLNEAASSTNVFFVRGLVGATTDQKVRGIFINNVA